MSLEHSGYLFRRLAFFENFPEERPQKSCSFYFATEFSGNVEHGFYFPEPPNQSLDKAPLLRSCGALREELILVNTWKTVELSQKVYQTLFRKSITLAVSHLINYLA